MKQFAQTLALGLATLLPAAAMAGGFTPAVEQAFESPAATDWTGFYAGVQAGGGNLRLDYPGGREDVDVTGYGIFAGYQQGLQNSIVLGAELDYNNLEHDDYGNADLFRLRAKAGADFGRFLTYVSVGAAHWDGGEVSETGVVYGVGADYKVSDRFLLGAEYTRHNFSDAVPSVPKTDLDLDLFQVRAAFRF